MSKNAKLLEEVEKLKGEKLSFPGLSTDELFKTFVWPELEKFNPDLKNYMDYLREENKEDELDKFIEAKKEELKPFIEENINIIKTEIKFIQENIPKLIKAIGFVITSSTAALVTISSTAALLPSGVATAAAMLIEKIPDINTKIENLKFISDGLKKSSSTLLEAAEKIGFPIPSPVAALIISIGSIDGMIEKIPIPS